MEEVQLYPSERRKRNGRRETNNKKKKNRFDWQEWPMLLHVSYEEMGSHENVSVSHSMGRQRVATIETFCNSVFFLIE